MNPDDMTDEEVAEMIAEIRRLLPLIALASHEAANADIALWELELATQGWAER